MYLQLISFRRSFNRTKDDHINYYTISVCRASTSTYENIEDKKKKLGTAQNTDNSKIIGNIIKKSPIKGKCFLSIRVEKIQRYFCIIL